MTQVVQPVTRIVETDAAATAATAGAAVYGGVQTTTELSGGIYAPSYGFGAFLEEETDLSRSFIPYSESLDREAIWLSYSGFDREYDFGLEIY